MQIYKNNKGILSSIYNKSVIITPSSIWHDKNTYDYNKVENLLDYDSCSDCSWWSDSIEKSFITFEFAQKFVIVAYLFQSMYVYPKSWNVYYTLHDDDWELLDYQKENDFFKVSGTIKKFHVKPTLIKKIKIEQLSSYNGGRSIYTNCFALKRVDFFPKEKQCTNRRTNKNNMQYFLALIVFS